MATSVIPSFVASQSHTHINLKVELPECPSTCSPRAVVDNGNIFGLACLHSHLPLVFPNETLVDGSSKLGEGQNSSIGLTKTGTCIKVDLLKRQKGKQVEGLEDLKPSVFPLLEDDDEGRNEERLVGLEMLQRGMEAMKSQGLTSQETSSNATASATASIPQAPVIGKDAKTRVHECSSNVALDGDERTNRTVAAYEAEEKNWDEGMFLDNFVDEDGEVKHLIQTTLESPPSNPGFVHQMKVHDDLTPELKKDMTLLLLDLLLAQAYDHRTTLGDATVESAWTIAVLCRSLVTSCIPSSESGDTVSSVLIGSIRRQLSYPLYRSWELSIKVARDVVSSLRQGNALLLLSQINGLFDQGEDEAMAVYSSNVIVPLIEGFESFFSPASVSLLADHLQSALEKVTKGQVGGNWDMEELEIAAKEALQEGEGGYI